MATAQKTRTEATATERKPLIGQVPAERSDPSFLAYLLLRIGFTTAPILFGIDKFFNWMVDWPQYLWVEVADFLPGTAQQIMYGVGVVEIAAGLVVFFAPRFGALLVAGWLGTIIANLVFQATFEDGPEYWDIALRDFGLFIGAIALFLLASKYGPFAARRYREEAAGNGQRTRTTA